MVSVHPGGVVAIRYLYGKPLFSPGVPLCALPPSGTSNSTGVVDYRAAGSGYGYIYLPQPNGTVVARIDVASNFWAILLLFLAVLVTALCLDVFLTGRLRQAWRARYSDR